MMRFLSLKKLLLGGLLSSIFPVIMTQPAPTDTLDSMCTTLQIFHGSSSLGYAHRTSNGYSFTSDITKATPFRLDATLLSRYQIFDNQGARIYMSVISWVMPGSDYGDRADWTFAITPGASRYSVTSTSTGQYLGMFLGTMGAAGSDYSVALASATGCYVAPDVDPNVTGTPNSVITSTGKLIGMMDMHMHLTAGAAFGGELHCGDSWALGGVEDALRSSCDGHKSFTIGAILESFLGGTSITNADGHGWPDFDQWPTYNSVLHEQTYYRSIERAWKSGIRMINAVMVANRVICNLFPYRDLPCDEMEQIRAQAKYLYYMQDYIDAKSGGTGKGWFRIAKTPAQARSIIANNQLAITIGVEMSELFGCSGTNSTACTNAVIDAGLGEFVSMGVSGLFPVHKFDNAFGGTRMDPAITGAFLNIGNLASSGHWWEIISCPTNAHDQPQPITNDDFVKFLALGAVNDSVPAGTIFPVYPTGPVCNIQGLTDAGQYLIKGMMKRGMIVHVDHMGVKTASMTLDVLQSMNYSGVVSEHSWSDYSIVDRVLAQGGVVGLYPTNYIAQYQQTMALPHSSNIIGLGLGSDVNGFAVQPSPRSDASTNPFNYPFTTLAGTSADKQTMGTRTFDINKDGVAQYGQYSEWTMDTINQAGVDGDMLRQQWLNGAEAWVRMWEKARANPVATTLSEQINNDVIIEDGNQQRQQRWTRSTIIGVAIGSACGGALVIGTILYCMYRHKHMKIHQQQRQHVQQAHELV